MSEEDGAWVENRRILIIDDEPEIREGYRSFLNPKRVAPITSSRGSSSPDDRSATYDFEITEADSGERALEIVRTELEKGRKFAGAVVDVRMPGKLDGLQFLQAAWEIDPDLLVVVVTAYQDRSVDDISRMFRACFQDQWDYLSKPFTSGEIVQKARQLVSSWNRRGRERLYLRTIREQQKTLVMQEQLAVVGRLAHSVGHDLGNVLQQVLTKLECADGPENTDLIEAVELGASICQDLLTFARQAKEQDASGAVKLSPSVGKAVRLLRQLIHRKAIRLVLDLDSAVQVKAQETKLVQVFVNLMTNAIQAMSDGGELRVTVKREGDASVAEVTDTGAGIAPENLSRIFEPLFSTKGEAGNGLGLTVCKKIVESYGGTIAVTSVVGQGSTVRIKFP